MNQKVNKNLRLSTAYHPQADRLSERAVQTSKQYLRIYCYDRQNRCPAWLPLAEFAYNTPATTAHTLSRYRSLRGFNAHTIHLYNKYKLSSPTTAEWLYRIITVRNHIHIDNVLECINHKRSTLHMEKARQFHIDNWVLVDRRNLSVKARNNNSLTRK